MLKEEFETILVHSQEFPFDVDATKLLEQWEKSKAPFIKMFDGKTYVRSKTPIKVTLSSEQRSRKFNEFIAALDSNAVLTEDFETFLRVNAEGFFDNKVILPYPTYHIPAGAKILKSFRKFLPNQEITRWAQDTASTYIQEDKIEGYIYLSVDPRDFLTLSENSYNWWSCQTLDGDYRSGNLSYMTDETTLVAYLADADPKHYNCLPEDYEWFDKKWRMLIHTDGEHCIYYNRQYPYESKELLLAVHDMLKKYLCPIFSEPFDYGFKVARTQWGNRMMSYNQINAGGRTYDMRDVVDNSDYIGYCDLISSSAYSPIVAVNEYELQNYIDKYSFEFGDIKRENEDNYFKEIFGIKVGDKVPCPVCGSGYVTRNDKLMCNDCIAERDGDEDYFLTCGGCGHRIYDNEAVFFDEYDTPYCSCCWRDYNTPIIDENELELVF